MISGRKNADGQGLWRSSGTIASCHARRAWSCGRPVHDLRPRLDEANNPTSRRSTAGPARNCVNRLEVLNRAAPAAQGQRGHQPYPAGGDGRAPTGSGQASRQAGPAMRKPTVRGSNRDKTGPQLWSARSCNRGSHGRCPACQIIRDEHQPAQSQADSRLPGARGERGRIRNSESRNILSRPRVSITHEAGQHGHPRRRSGRAPPRLVRPIVCPPNA